MKLQTDRLPVFGNAVEVVDCRFSSNTHEVTSAPNRVDSNVLKQADVKDTRQCPPEKAIEDSELPTLRSNVKRVALTAPLAHKRSRKASVQSELMVRPRLRVAY